MFDSDKSRQSLTERVGQINSFSAQRMSKPVREFDTGPEERYQETLSPAGFIKKYRLRVKPEKVKQKMTLPAAAEPAAVGATDMDSIQSQ